MKQNIGVFIAALAIGLLAQFGCTRADRHQNWSKTTGEITSIEPIVEEKSSVANTRDYRIKFAFKVNGVEYTGVQKTSELKANLLSEGQDIEIRINPEDIEKSEIVVPAPYPDKSGMQWRRMPKSLTTNSYKLNESNSAEFYRKSSN